MKRFIKVLSVFLLVAILLPASVSAAEGVGIKRLFGESRVHTSLEISRESNNNPSRIKVIKEFFS